MDFVTVFHQWGCAIASPAFYGNVKWITHNHKEVSKLINTSQMFSEHGCCRFLLDLTVTLHPEALCTFFPGCQRVYAPERLMLRVNRTSLSKWQQQGALLYHWSCYKRKPLSSSSLSSHSRRLWELFVSVSAERWAVITSNAQAGIKTGAAGEQCRCWRRCSARVAAEQPGGWGWWCGGVK